MQAGAHSSAGLKLANIILLSIMLCHQYKYGFFLFLSYFEVQFADISANRSAFYRYSDHVTYRTRANSAPS